MNSSEYWKQHYENSFLEFRNSPFKQIGKTVNGSEVGERELSLIVSHITHQLGLKNSDRLIDLGCGNGLLTVRLSKIVKKVIGLDFAEGLLSYAQTYNQSKNVRYIRSDLMEMAPQLLAGVNKLSMYEVLQHLTYDGLSVLLSKLDDLESGAQFFIGGIPNKEKIRIFYDTNSKYSYFLQRERQGRPHLGRWWLVSELQEISANHGWAISDIPQPINLYTSCYRFDALLKKK